MKNGFFKGHGLGNDYLVMAPKELEFALTPAKIRAICDRHRGVGSDGILTLEPSSKADFGLRIYNPDGSEAEKSGNGLRIFARYLYDHGRTTKSHFTVETPGGLVRIELHLHGRDVEDITVEMGPATFRSDRIPVAGPPRDVVDEQIEVDGELFTVTAVSVGNPHCVVFVPDLSRVDLHRWGPRLERHVLFPNRINVQFAQVQSRARVVARIWERGAGETMASGSSACAVAAAAVRKGLTDRAVTISMPGGELKVEVDAEWSLTLTGPAVEVYEGTLSEGFASLLRGQ